MQRRRAASIFGGNIILPSKTMSRSSNRSPPDRAQAKEIQVDPIGHECDTPARENTSVKLGVKLRGIHVDRGPAEHRTLVAPVHQDLPQEAGPASHGKVSECSEIPQQRLIHRIDDQWHRHWTLRQRKEHVRGDVQHEIVFPSGDCSAYRGSHFCTARLEVPESERACDSVRKARSSRRREGQGANGRKKIIRGRLKLIAGSRKT